MWPHQAYFTDGGWLVERIQNNNNKTSAAAVSQGVKPPNITVPKVSMWYHQVNAELRQSQCKMGWGGGGHGRVKLHNSALQQS